MTKKIMWAAIAVLVGAAIVAGVWFAGEARPLIFTIVAVGLGTFIGINWGSKKATETDEYCQAWLSGKNSPERGAESDDNPESDEARRH